MTLCDSCCCSVQEQPDLEGSALALVQSQPLAGHQDAGAGLVQEVAALLQRVAPQLDELAGLKQQMGQLMSALQPGKLRLQKTCCWQWAPVGVLLQDGSLIRLSQMTYLD